MSIDLTERERERIEEFARTPAYERTPEQLLPDEPDEERARDAR